MPDSGPFFCEFHALSAFSFLRGASQPEALVERAAELGYPAVAITDHAGFYGSARAHTASKEAGVRALVGATLEAPDGRGFYPVLCATQNGYQALSRHLTRLHFGERPTEPLVEPGHLVALTGGRDGPIVRLLLKDDTAGALKAAQALMATHGTDSVFVELQRHGLRDDARLNRHLIQLAEHLRLPILATNSPLYATRQERLLADAFTCLRHHTSLDAAGLLLEPNGERHLRSPRTMVDLFRDLAAAIDNGRRLLDRLGFSLENLGYRFPDYPDGRGFPLSQAEQGTMLRRFTYEGAFRRYGCVPRKVKEQLEHEIAMIQRLGFSGYFLIVREIVEYARGRGILCQGRGSAANSAVCFCLGITAFDPVASGLLFERFLSENRQAWPDIDIDFPSGDRREEVIQHVFRKYGRHGAAMTANVITYRPRSAFREMSKVLGFPPSVADRFSAQSSGYKADGAVEDEHAEVEFDFEEAMGRLLPPSHPRLRALDLLFHMALGKPRHLGQHSGGVIVCDRGLDGVVPLQPATMPDRHVVQWDKDDCEDLGIVKIDLLGLGMLAAMEDAIRICNRRGKAVELATIPHDDEAVYDLMCKADTVGTFQIESRAQMATLPILKPRCFYDVAVEVAIIRPGPIVGEMRHPYLNRRNGHEAVDHIHPLCEPILERTLGVILFQEQILRIAMEVAGFTGAEADELRRAMGSKRSQEKMQRVVAKLRAGMTERGLVPLAQEKILQSIGAFALYGFPESHAISFALIAYASCWLKVHHPAEFYAGLINNQPMGFYSVHTLIQDAKRRGVKIRPVSVVESGTATEVSGDRELRLGLHRIKGLTRETLARIAAARARQPFSSLGDFLLRCKPNDKERRLLAKSGALNGLPSIDHRRNALWQSELKLHHDLIPDQPGDTILERMQPAELLAADFATQGASTGPHPMKLWRQQHPGEDVVRACDLRRLPHGFPVRIAGMAICRQRPGTASGHCFISLEDETGIANLFVHVKTFRAYRLVIVTESFILAEGRVQQGEGDQASLYVTTVRPLQDRESLSATASHDFR